MHKRGVYLLTVLILFGAFIYGVKASSNPVVTLQVSGVTIDVEYPEEAHPNSTITYGVTITANTNITSLNIGVFIYASVNSTLQLIKNQPITWATLHENQSLPTTEIPIPLPELSNGTLKCVITVQTSQTAARNCSFYTTHVSELTFGEMQSLYNEILLNYTQLQNDYETLLSQYVSLLMDYNSSLGNYTTLLGQYGDLQSKYDNEVVAFNVQLNSNDKLSQDYSTLNALYKSTLNKLGTSQADFEVLNNTKNSLQASYNNLETTYTSLNQNCTSLLEEISNLQNSIKISESDVNNSRIFLFVALVAVIGLIGLISYLKRKQPEPYVIIRKETVALKPDKKEEPQT
jgi:ribosomal protein S15P/S13E